MLTGAFLLGCFLSALFAQEMRTTLFKEADVALQEAKEVHAHLLAPKSFSEGMKYYRSAEEDLNKGRNLEDIRKKVSAATEDFKKATKATKLAEVTFGSSLEARNDAIKVNATDYAQEIWRNAEQKFEEAAEELEDGDVNSAKKKSAEAEKLYRQAELAGIKARYLNETWQLLKQADRMDVGDRAPITLEHAKTLANEAEKELKENRYDTDVARSLAQQAQSEAGHAIYLSKTIKKLKDKDATLEDLLLAAEKPLQKIAGTLDIVASFENGLGEPTDKIIATITAHQDSLAVLSQNLSERDQRINILTARIDELEDQLGGAQSEKTALTQEIEAQEKIRQKFSAIEKLFSREEAQVLREANDVIIRLVGLNFDVGQSVIKPEYFGLLTKVQQAINTFPNAEITIEGHTDSYGSDQTNLKLSIDRAEAVEQYILANMGLEPSRISAVGYGESKPIANNETSEGRKKNRRIDVVIHPQLPSTF